MTEDREPAADLARRAAHAQDVDLDVDEPWVGSGERGGGDRERVRAWLSALSAGCAPSGMEFHLSNGSETTIGRKDPVTGIYPDIDLTPVDSQRSVSRRHAKIYRRGNKYFFGEEMQQYFLDEQKEMVWASNQPDFSEAVNSFIEKRRPEMNKQ